MIILLTAIAIVLPVLAVVLFYAASDCVIIAVNWFRAWREPAGPSSKFPTP